MKKLSEIGTHYKPEPDSITQFGEYWTLTKDDRRELVTEAIRRWEAYKWHKLGGAKELEDFCKEQGI